MKLQQTSRLAQATLALTLLASTQCTVGKYPPDEHNKVARAFIHNSAIHDPFGVLMAGLTSVKTGQEFNLAEESLEGGQDISVLSALPDFSSEGRATQEALYESLVVPFTAPVESEEGFDSSKLPPELWAENGTLLNRAQRMLHQLREEKPHENHPLRYIEELGMLLYASMELNYAPANDRFAAIVQRLTKTPAYLETAKANLVSSSELRVTAARDATAGLISLIQGDLTDRMPESLSSGFQEAAGGAVDALRDFDRFLRQLPSDDDWRAGEDLLHRKLVLNTGRPLPRMADLLADTEDEFKASHDALVAAAEPINREIYGGARPRDDFRLINDVLEVLEGENRARSSRGMMDQMSEDTDSARKICNDEEIAPVPEALQLKVVETPEFMRISVPLGGGVGPTAAPQDNTAVVWLTPAPADASRAELRDRLTTNNIFQLRLLALRFGIPGNALIGSLGSEMETDEKKLTHMVEPLPGFMDGWPVYITETTVGTAYTGEVDFIWQKYKLQTVGAALIDMQMHAGALTALQAVQLLTRQAHMEASAARALVRSIQVNPGVAATVYIGWRNWQQLKAHYQEATQDFSLTSFHGKALRTGSMPVEQFSYAVSEAAGQLRLDESSID